MQRMSVALPWISRRRRLPARRWRLSTFCVIVAGTSATVYPAAGFPIAIAERGGDLIEVNPYPSDLTPLCRITLGGAAGEVLPALVERVRQLRR